MSRRAAALFLLLGVLPLSAASRQTPQQPVPRFRSGVELVVLDVSVLDKDRQPVHGLTAADFTVLEDGKPQEVASFSAVDLPDVVEETTTTAPWVRGVAPDVRRNTDLKDRRIVVIVMDDATPMPAAEVPQATRLARQVIDALGPNDLACVAYTFSKRSGQEFTQDKARLLAAVERFNGAIDNTPGIDAMGVDKSVPFDEFNFAATTLYEGTLLTIKGLADDLTALPGRRKALVLVSVGIPLEAPEVAIAQPGAVGRADVIQHLSKSLQASFTAAQRANVTIYGLDPGGLRAPYGVASSDPAHPGRLNGEFLRTVAENTGGFTIVDTNGAGPQIQQIVRENASYYLLGYAPSNVRALGRYRRVNVRVNRPGLTVRARTGYFEPDAGEAKKKAAVPGSGATAAMAGVLPNADLSMSLVVAPFAGPGQRNATLAVVAGLQCPAPRRQGRVTERVDIRVAAYTPTGDERAAIHQVMPVTVNASGEGGTIRFELLARLDLPPGRYHVRAAAERMTDGTGATEDVGGRSGSVYTDVDVPDFRRESLALSGLTLNVSPAVMSGPKDALAAVVPLAPTTVREFRAEDRVTAFLRVHQGGDRPLVPAGVAITIVDAKGAIVFESVETIAAERFGPVRASDVGFDVPVAKIAPGPHLLTVEVTAGKATARREVRFVVEG